MYNNNYNNMINNNFMRKKIEADRILSKHPDKIPIIVKKNRLCHDLPKLDKLKYLVPFDLTLYKFSYILRNRLNLPSHQAFIMYNIDPYSKTKRFLNGSSLLAEVYSNYKSPDGFLYMEFDSENTFG
jgi:hypothetical protein